MTLSKHFLNLFLRMSTLHIPCIMVNLISSHRISNSNHIFLISNEVRLSRKSHRSGDAKENYLTVVG